MAYGQRESGGAAVQPDRDASKAVVARLMALQGERTDADMAATLHVSRVHWSRLKSGHRDMSYAAMKRAAKAFPEVMRIVMHDLSHEECAS